MGLLRDTIVTLQFIWYLMRVIIGNDAGEDVKKEVRYFAVLKCKDI